MLTSWYNDSCSLRSLLFDKSLRLWLINNGRLVSFTFDHHAVFLFFTLTTLGFLSNKFGFGVDFVNTVTLPVNRFYCGKGL